jgi:hypothetical protein
MKKMKKIILLASLAFSINAIAQVPSYVPTNGLVGWWPFNGNANDESGNGNNGTNLNNVGFDQDRFGNNSASLVFPNFNSKIWIPFDLLGPLPCSNDHSFSFWVKLNSQASQNGNQQSIAFCNGRLPGQSGINAFGNWYYLYPNNVLEGAWYDRSQTRSIDSITTNTWHLIVYVYATLTNRIKVYIDGIEKTDYNFPSVASGWSGNCIAPNPPFGNYYVGNSPYDNAKFDGNVDDLGVWNRALNQQEITDLYNGNICYQTITVTDTLLINMGITGYNPVTYNNTIKIFPNPTNDHITIDYGNFASLNGYQLKIINSLSQNVFQTNITQQSDYLNLTTWGGNGLYFVQIIDQQGNIIDIRKIVLQ